MPTDPAIAALERKVAALETTIKELAQAIKVTGNSVQITGSAKLTLKTSSGAQIELSGPTVNVNNGALEVI